MSSISNPILPQFYGFREDTRRPLATSSGSFLRKREVLNYRQRFACHWQKFIQENFESPAHVAHTFKVDGTTAEKWWDGDHGPQGWVIGMAFENPESRDAAIGFFSGGDAK